MKTITVKVTKEDIDAGCRHSCEWCPVARAIRRSVASDTNVTVGRGVVYLGKINSPSDHGHVSLPEQAVIFIDLFDHIAEREDWTPVSFEFTLEVPDYL